MTLTSHKASSVLLLAISLSFAGAFQSEAQVSGKTENTGRSAPLSAVSLTSSSWSELASVQASTRSAGFCAATATFVTELPVSSVIRLTLASTSASRGEALLRFENVHATPKNLSESVTEVFQVGARQDVTFYLNGSLLTGTTTDVEVTSFTVICGIGAPQG